MAFRKPEYNGVSVCSQIVSENVVSSIFRHKQEANKKIWRWALIVQVVVNPTTMRSRLLRPSPCILNTYVKQAKFDV